jgi:hypothetical protein
MHKTVRDEDSALAKYPVSQSGVIHDLEHIGTREKFWFRGSDSTQYLCKIVRASTGEDWSEKIAAEVANALGLPHAEYELGTRGDDRCVLSRFFVPNDCILLHGDELLGISEQYQNTALKKFRQSTHTVNAVWEALYQADCRLPHGWPCPSQVKNAHDVFTGYVLLDAVVGNTDRHHQNWGVFESSDYSGSQRFLAPTFDHASSLACHLLDEDRSARLYGSDSNYTVETYANRARSKLYRSPHDNRAMLTVEAFFEVSVLCPAAAAFWVDRLSTLTADSLQGIINAVPDHLMSEAARAFALRYMVHNIRRLATAP